MSILRSWIQPLFALLLGISFSADSDAREKPVRVIVPFAPGGGSDTLARLFSRAINDSGRSSAPWVIVNIPGAGGTIGSRRAKNAIPDGRTLLFLHDGILTAQFAGQALYGPDAFTPLAATGSVGMVICVHEDSEFAGLPALLQEASSHPETVTFAANLGAPSYFMARIIEHTHGSARFRYVQSGGGASRFADLSGGHITASAFSVSEYLSFRSGGLRAIAFLGEDRHESLPDVPTAAESGLAISYRNLQGWWLPKGASEETVEKLSAILSETMKQEDVREVFREQQIEPVFLKAGELKAAVEKKATELEALNLGHERQTLPNLLFPLLGMLGVGFAITAISKPVREEKKEAAATKQSPIPIAFAILAYLVALHFLDGFFVPLSIGFILGIAIPTIGKAAPWKTVITAVSIPLLLHLFLQTVLGYQLP